MRESMTIAIAGLCLGVYGWQTIRRWRAWGWMPRIFWIVGGGLLAGFWLRPAPGLVFWGAGLLAVSQLVPRSGWRRRPGDG